MKKLEVPVNETINIFSIASGHLYERFLRLAVLIFSGSLAQTSSLIPIPACLTLTSPCLIPIPVICFVPIPVCLIPIPVFVLFLNQSVSFPYQSLSHSQADLLLCLSSLLPGL